MPVYTYSARAINGELKNATIDAPSREEAVAQLRKQRLNVSTRPDCRQQHTHAKTLRGDQAIGRTVVNPSMLRMQSSSVGNVANAHLQYQSVFALTPHRTI